MYCKSCGQSIPDGSNYCLYDGTTLSDTSASRSFKLANKISDFCPECGEKTNGQDNYCTGCGQSLLKLTKTEKEGKSQQIRKENTKVLNSSGTLWLEAVSIAKKSLLPAIIAFLATLLFSYVLSSFFNASYDKVFKESLGYSPSEIIEEFSYEFDVDVDAPGKIIGFTDIVMASHLLSPTYMMEGISNVDFENGKMNGELAINGASIILVLIPLITLLAAGIIYRKKNPEVSLHSFLSGAIGIGLIYTLLLSIMSLFSGFHYELQLAEAGEHVSFTMDTSYSFLFTLLKGFFIGAGFSLLGMLFSINYRRMTKQLGQLMPYGEAVHQGFAAFIRGFGVMIVITVITIVTKMNDIKEKLEWMDIPYFDQLLKHLAAAVASISVNLAAMIYSMIHFSPLTFEASEGSFESAGSISYNIWTGFSATGAAMESDLNGLEFMFSSNDIDLWLKLSIIIPVALLIFAGFMMGKAGQANFKSLAVFSLVYAIFVALLTGVASMGFEGSMRVFGEDSERIRMSLTINALKSLIGSFILAYIAGFAGSFFNKFLPRHIK